MSILQPAWHAVFADSSPELAVNSRSGCWENMHGHTACKNDSAAKLPWLPDVVLLDPTLFSARRITTRGFIKDPASLARLKFIRATYYSYAGGGFARRMLSSRTEATGTTWTKAVPDKESNAPSVTRSGAVTDKVNCQNPT